MTDDSPTWRMTTAASERLPAGASYAGRGPQWLLVVDGTACLETGGVAEVLRAGDAVLVAPRQSVSVTACVETLLVRNDLALLRPTHPLPDVLVVRGFGTQHEGVAALVRLCPVATTCGPELMTASYANLLGSAMTASWLEAEGRAPRAPSYDDPAVTTVVAAVTDRPGEAWTVERMADLVHLSRSALGERFRRELRRSPTEVVRDARMQEARRLLAGGGTGAVQVEQVAHAVGYGSAAAFSRAFTTHHGTSPQAWRATSAGRGPRRAQRPEDRTTRDGQPGTQQQRRHDSVTVDERAS